jgi:hypothetical protein
MGLLPVTSTVFTHSSGNLVRRGRLKYRRCLCYPFGDKALVLCMYVLLLSEDSLDRCTRNIVPASSKVLPRRISSLDTPALTWASSPQSGRWYTTRTPTHWPTSTWSISLRHSFNRFIFITMYWAPVHTTAQNRLN